MKPRKVKFEFDERSERPVTLNSPCICGHPVRLHAFVGPAECLRPFCLCEELRVRASDEQDLSQEQESLLAAQTELTAHLLHFVEAQLARAERAEAERDEIEQHLADALLAQTRLEAENRTLRAAVEGKRG